MEDGCESAGAVHLHLDVHPLGPADVPAHLAVVAPPYGVDAAAEVHDLGGVRSGAERGRGRRRPYVTVAGAQAQAHPERGLAEEVGVDRPCRAGSGVALDDGPADPPAARPGLQGVERPGPVGAGQREDDPGAVVELVEPAGVPVVALGAQAVEPRGCLGDAAVRVPSRHLPPQVPGDGGGDTGRAGPDTGAGVHVGLLSDGRQGVARAATSASTGTTLSATQRRLRP
ncbi:hypothetical protein ACE6JH_29850 [Streptomyces nigra]